MYTTMDIQKKINELLAEKEQKIAAELEAHARIVAIDRKVKSLRRALKDVEEILSDATPVLSENGQD